MPSPSVVFAAWLGAAAVVSITTWQGIGLIGAQVTQSRPAPLDASAVLVALSQPPTPPSEQGGELAAPDDQQGMSPVVPGNRPFVGGGQPNPDSPPPSASIPPNADNNGGGGSGGGPNRNITGGPIVGTGGNNNPVVPTTVPTTAKATPSTRPVDVEPAAMVKTYHLTGGTASLRFSSDGVTVIFANPQPGFRSEIKTIAGNGVRVEFEGDGHRSRVTGTWVNGAKEKVDENSLGGGFSPNLKQ